MHTWVCFCMCFQCNLLFPLMTVIIPDVWRTHLWIFVSNQTSINLSNYVKSNKSTRVLLDSGADLKLGLQSVDGSRHSSGDNIGQSCCENKCPPCTQTRRPLWELDGHRTTLTHIKNLQTEEIKNYIRHPLNTVLLLMLKWTVNVSQFVWTSALVKCYRIGVMWPPDLTRLCFQEDTSSPMSSTGLRMIWWRNSSQSTVIELSLSILVFTQTTGTANTDFMAYCHEDS